VLLAEALGLGGRGSVLPTALLRGSAWMSGRAAVAAAERGELRDAKSILALLWLARLRG